MAYRDFDRAAAAFLRARSADPRSFAAAVGLAQMADVRGRRDEAVGLWREAAQFRPDSVEAQWRLAQALMRDDRKGDAEAAARRVLALKADHADAKALLEFLKAR